MRAAVPRAPAALAVLLAIAGLVAAPRLAGAVAVAVPGEGRDMDLGVALQVWTTATLDARADGQELDARGDLYLRRARLGVRGHVRPDVAYNVTFAFDNVGKGYGTALTGTAQDDDNALFQVWDAYLTVALDPDRLNLTLGYLRPQIGRESITSGLNVTSLVKSLCNSYPREHLVGRGNGRETGLNVGGLLRGRRTTVNYNLGVFDTNHRRNVGEAPDPAWAPLWAGRLAVSLGDPELDRYGIGYRENFRGRRRGVTVAVNGTWQGRTTGRTVYGTREDYAGGFERNTLLGCDILANHGPWSLAAEYDVMERRIAENSDDLAEHYFGDFTGLVWMVRAAWCTSTCCDRWLEPVVMVSGFEADADHPYYPDGEQELVDVGVNWYLDGGRMKVNLHYIFQDGRPISRYETGSDRLGDAFGLGLQVVF